MSNYSSPADIANRALQHLGATHITTLTDNSKNAYETNFAYDKCRRAELRANAWNFAARRLVLRPFIPNVSLLWVPGLWSANGTYGIGSVVNNDDVNWVSGITPNANVTPGGGVNIPYFQWTEFFQPVYANPWVPGTTYYPGELVVVGGTTGHLWIALTATSLAPTGSPWLDISAAGGNTVGLEPTQLFAPQGLTTASLSAPKPAYAMPNGYIRVMPQDAKSAATPAQLSTAGMQNSDYEFEGKFLLTNSTKGGPLVFRFTADVHAVQWFDDLFSEMVAVRIANDLCEVITQSPAKKQALHALYEEYLGRAQKVNAIEAGSTEPDTIDVKTNRRPSIEKSQVPQQAPR